LKLNTEVSSSVASVSGDNDTIAVRAALALLRGYKLTISPYFRGSCRFLPTCADYAAIAISRHGVLHGTWLATRRLARCHPLAEAGHDPVPVPRSAKASRSTQPMDREASAERHARAR
jgi:uncharacterized protein